MEAAGDMKGAVIATNQGNELCHKTMEIFATVSQLQSYEVLSSSHRLFYLCYCSYRPLCYTLLLASCILLLQAYGAEAGVAALKWLPYGGRGVQPSEKLTQMRKWESALVR